MTLQDDHGDLPAHAEVLIGRLAGLRGEFAGGKVLYAQHLQHAGRGRVLADHLRGMLALSSSRHYAATFAVARTALEHHLLDRLLFLGDRWVRDYPIKPGKVAAEEANLKALKAGPRPDILKWWFVPKSSSMRVLYRGVFREGSLGRGATVSPYFFHVDRYDPFTVHQKLAPRLATGFRDPDADRRWATESTSARHRLLSFRGVLENLVINRLLPPRLVVQVEVHHSFLSAYVHGAQKAYELIYGHNRPISVGTFDHYASELCLLYVIVISAAELEAFGRMARRTPRLRLHDWPSVEGEIAAAKAASSHLWFLTGEPHIYDRIQELDTRTPMRPGSRPWRRKFVDPASLRPASVRYYLNPLRRLISLHSSYTELMTGHRFESPFERADARFRR